MFQIEQHKPDDPDGRVRPFNVAPLRNAWSGQYRLVPFAVGHENVQKRWGLLKQAYQSIYLDNFPLKKGNESIEKWQRLLDAPNAHMAYQITVAVKNPESQDCDAGQPKGILVSVFYKKSRTGHLAYVAVDQDTQGTGLGKSLFLYHQDTVIDMAAAYPSADGDKTLHGSYLECHATNQKLIDMYGRWGAIPAECDGYALPTSGGKIMKDLALISLPLDPQAPEDQRTYGDSPAEAGFVRDIWIGDGCPTPSKHDEYWRMVRSMPFRDLREMYGFVTAKKPSVHQGQDVAQALRP